MENSPQGDDVCVPVQWRRKVFTGGRRGGANGAMAPPLAREGGAILSFGPTFHVKEKR